MIKPIAIQCLCIFIVCNCETGISQSLDLAHMAYKLKMSSSFAAIFYLLLQLCNCIMCIHKK